MSAELERLRRRLYVPGAGQSDLAAYRVALAAAPPPEAPAAAIPARPPGIRRPPGPVLLAVLGGAVAVLAVLSASLGAAAGPGAGGVVDASPETAVQPPIERAASPRGLTSQVAVQRLIDRVFTDQGSEASAAATDALDRRIRVAVLPRAGRATALAGAGGSTTGGRAVLQLGEAGIPVGAGEVLLLSVVTREPVADTWRVVGWRRGEPHVPHVLVAVRSQSGGSDRLAVATVRAPSAMTLTSVEVRVAPVTPLAYRLEVHSPSACGHRGASTCG